MFCFLRCTEVKNEQIPNLNAPLTKYINIMCFVKTRPLIKLIWNYFYLNQTNCPTSYEYIYTSRK